MLATLVGPVAACRDEAPVRSGFDEPVRVVDGFLREGELPIADGGPEVTAVEVTNAIALMGQRGRGRQPRRDRGGGRLGGGRRRRPLQHRVALEPPVATDAVGREPAPQQPIHVLRMHVEQPRDLDGGEQTGGGARALDRRRWTRGSSSRHEREQSVTPAGAQDNRRGARPVR